ncbi:response regulator [Ectothiorhodospiraceae bacterium BW-2]|nr:response regulator [Ectothiorhodospiraceae bacterium BW-2]
MSGRVLVVDDEELLTLFYEEILGDYGLSVVCCHSGFEALELFNEPPPFDLLITDQSMLGMEGTELIERLKGVQPSLKTVLCSGLSEPYRLDAKADAILDKPLDIEALYRVLDRLLGRV